MIATRDTAAESLLGSVPDLDRLAQLTPRQCADLAARIRSFLVETVTRTGGHLGANLSTVELTIALHRTFASPETRIIWDTGHQCYTHKILTGRRREFATLRSRHGLSGFPSRAESVHDLLENSHASVGPAWAYGVALATGRPAVVVVGDGALTGGVAYEALNAIGHHGAQVIVVVNDNGRSYAATPSNLTYGEPVTGASGRQNKAGAFFDALGFRYRGPVDGHDIAALCDAFAWAADGFKPCVVHVRTQKGQGWPAALADQRKRLHDVSPHPDGDAAPDALPSWSAVAGQALTDLAASDPRVHAITAAMPDTLGLDEFKARHPSRYHDLGIAEQACMALAAGLASQGQRPFFAVVATFLTRALDQLHNDVALHNLPVVLLVDRAGVTGPDGPSHHGVYDVGFLRNVPGMQIFSPATADEVRLLLRDLLARDHGPVAVRYPKGAPSADGLFATTTSGLMRAGRDAVLIGHGPTSSTALSAARLLRARDGADCSVWRPTRIHPLEDALVQYAARQRLVVPIEEVGEQGSIAAQLAYRLSRGGHRPVEIEPVTVPAGFLPHGERGELLEEWGLTAAGVADFVARLLGRSQKRPA